MMVAGRFFWCRIKSKIADLPRSGYAEIVRLANELHNPELGLFRVRLASAESPLARDVLEASRYYRAGRRIDFGVMLFGDLTVEEGYFYPLPTSAEK